MRPRCLHDSVPYTKVKLRRRESRPIHPVGFFLLARFHIRNGLAIELVLYLVGNANTFPISFQAVFDLFDLSDFSHQDYPSRENVSDFLKLIFFN